MLVGPGHGVPPLYMLFNATPGIPPSTSPLIGIIVSLRNASLRDLENFRSFGLSCEVSPYGCSGLLVMQSASTMRVGILIRGSARFGATCRIMLGLSGFRFAERLLVMPNSELLASGNLTASRGTTRFCVGD